jgi:indole-3-glycerol phosphate synthase
MAWLGDFLSAKRAHLAAAKAAVPAAELLARAAQRPPPRDFAAALRGGARPGVIAEVKFASPSLGPLRPARDVEAVAAGYAAAGAAALSVLTEPTAFAGDLAFLSRAAAASGLPVLRKDFLLDPYEVAEARAAGADALLLIARLLDPSALAALLERTRDLGMTALVELHREEELALLEGLPVAVVGVNHRDLDTLALDRDLSARLAPHLPPGTVRVAESGLETGADLRRMGDLGYDAVLVGSAFMSKPDPGAALADLLGEARRAE